MSEIEVEPGQVWADRDWRCEGRLIRVVEVHREMADGTPFHIGYAIVEQVAHGDPVRAHNNGRRPKIRLNRFKPTSTGYRLVSEPEQNGTVR